MISYDVDYYYKDELLTKIHVKGREVTFENYSDEVILIAFGVRTEVTYEDLEEFYESRCFPRERANARELLHDLGVDFYDQKLYVERLMVCNLMILCGYNSVMNHKLSIRT